jgi:uncharacterized protein (DUF433 family)
VPKFDRITYDPGVMGGKACIRGMRITAALIAGMVRHGHSVEELLSDYPYLEREDIIQALCYETKTWGTASLIFEGISLVVYVCCFLVFRFDLPHLSLLAFDGFIPRYCIGLALISGAIAICGLFMDRSRNRSIEALVFLIAELTVMGVLAGHW